MVSNGDELLQAPGASEPAATARHRFLGSWLIEHDPDGADVRVVAYGYLPYAYLWARLRRRCRRYQRQGYEVVSTFGGSNLELFATEVQSLDWDHPRVPMAGARLRNRGASSPGGRPRVRVRRRPPSGGGGSVAPPASPPAHDELAWVRRQLDAMAHARLGAPFTPAETMDYERLASEEEFLLQRRA